MFIFQVIKAVKQADGTIDRTVKIKLCHILQKQRYGQILAFKPSLCHFKHFGRVIYSHNVIALLRELFAERPRTARKVKYHLFIIGILLHKRMHQLCDALVIDVIGQRIIKTRKALVACIYHFLSFSFSLFIFSKTMLYPPLPS